MNDNEKQDLAELHRKCDGIRKTAFWAMQHDLRLTPEELKHTGYKTVEAAVIGSYKHAQKQIDDLTKAHIRKYPD